MAQNPTFFSSNLTKIRIIQEITNKKTFQLQLQDFHWLVVTVFTIQHINEPPQTKPLMSTKQHSIGDNFGVKLENQHQIYSRIRKIDTSNNEKEKKMIVNYLRFVK